MEKVRSSKTHTPTLHRHIQGIKFHRRKNVARKEELFQEGKILKKTTAEGLPKTEHPDLAFVILSRPSPTAMRG